jgi:type I restriction enzyme S subunit
MSLPRYAKYKDSGVEWLGEVPEEWEVTRLKRVASVRPSNVDKKSYDGEIRVALCNYTDVYYNDSITADMEFMQGTASAEQIGRFSLRSGDTILTKDSETPDDIARSAFVPRDLPGVVCGYHLALVRPMEGTSGEFFKWFFDSHFARACVEVRANGLTRYGLSQYALDSLPIAIPCSDDQSAIAEFLKTEAAKIDALVEEQQQRLIELLKEKRQAVVSHAVTKGLSPNAPMKPSGINWIGEVPKHWTVKPIKLMADVRNGSTPSREEPGYWTQEGFPWLSSTAVNQEDIEAAEEFVTERALAECTLPRIEPPAVLLGITGQGRTRGMASTLRIPATINQHVAAIMPRSSDVDVHYMRRFFDMAYDILRSDSEGGGSTKAAITCEQLANIKMCIPPFHEQRDIAEFLACELSRLNALTVQANQAINLLQERRSALISAAVTGKIDVRASVSECVA